MGMSNVLPGNEPQVAAEVSNVQQRAPRDPLPGQSGDSYNEEVNDQKDIPEAIGQSKERLGYGTAVDNVSFQEKTEDAHDVFESLGYDDSQSDFEKWAK